MKVYRFYLEVLLVAASVLASFSPSFLVAADTASSERWYVDTERLAPHNIDIRRGETRYIEPTFRSYGSALNLSDANTVIMNYKSTGMTGSVYCVTGSVVTATSGVVRIRWTSAYEATNDSYTWDMPISGSSGTIVRAYGTINLIDSVADVGDTNSRPREFSTIDFATVNLLNVGLAPFVSSYDIDDVRNFMNGCLNGSQSLDVLDVTIRGVLAASAAGLSNFPSYLARTNDMSFAKGADETPARIEQITPTSYVIHFPITGSQEILTTNRLTWVVNGETIGYVDTNGITMLMGSLQLFDDDLNCNVRAYDGSKNAPSVSFYASPLIGWYRKSYLGDYAWAFAHTSNDVLYLHRQGGTVAGTNVWYSYYFNSAGAYQFNGTNGGTTNISVITAVLTNGSGNVTGTVSQTLHFRGGLYFNE